MKYTVITTFNQAGLDTYGQRMIDSFEKFWPAEVHLMICTENCTPKITRSNVSSVDLVEQSPMLRDFLHRHASNDLAHGRAGPPGIFDPKKQFRWDAVRFSYKVFSVALCAGMIDSGWMIWLDADSHTHSVVTLSWLDAVCPGNAMISYLGRGERYHSECGWVGYNLDHAMTKNFISDFVGMYETDKIFDHPEWHDSYIWDIVRRKYHQQNLFHNLNHDQNTKLAGHPFINSVLGTCMDHAKGSRKSQGRSMSKDIKQHLDHPYWKKIVTNG